jgi:hypothetical protein
MPVGELLFELTGQANMRFVSTIRLAFLSPSSFRTTRCTIERRIVPLLDFVKTLKQWHRDEDSNGFLSMANLNL